MMRAHRQKQSMGPASIPLSGTEAASWVSHRRVRGTAPGVLLMTPPAASDVPPSTASSSRQCQHQVQVVGSVIKNSFLVFSSRARARVVFSFLFFGFSCMHAKNRQNQKNQKRKNLKARVARLLWKNQKTKFFDLMPKKLKNC